MKVLFRAKDKNINNYVIGYEYYNHIEDEYYITHYASGNNYKIDRSTRSINFEDMLDSQGNKIFASLQEDGKGGDICRIESEMENYVAEFTKEGLKFYEYLDNGKIVNSSYYKVFSIRDIKVIGIQE